MASQQARTADDTLLGARDERAYHYTRKMRFKRREHSKKYQPPKTTCPLCAPVRFGDILRRHGRAIRREDMVDPALYYVGDEAEVDARDEEVEPRASYFDLEAILRSMTCSPSSDALSFEMVESDGMSSTQSVCDVSEEWEVL